MEKFDLDPRYASLLETYDFEDISSPDAMHCLQALERVRKIRLELSTVHVFSTSSQQETSLGATSAIRMTESLAKKQEAAYENLYHWLQAHLQLHQNTNNSSSQEHNYDVDATDEALSHTFVRQALKTLQHVPAFYTHLLEMIATAQRVQVTRKFLLALTSGYDGRAPMEVKAHDPVQYVGDMLAFLFQVTSVQADNVQHGYALSNEEGEEGGGDKKDDALITTNTSDSLDDDLQEERQQTMTAQEMLAHSLSGEARPLKSCIRQVAASLARKEGKDDKEEDDDEDQEGVIARSRVVALYTFCGLLVYYHAALLKSVQHHESNPLVVAVMDCLKEASQAYAASSLKVYAAMLDSLALLTGESEAVLAQLLVNIVSTSSGFAAHVECPSDKIKSLLSIRMMTETLLQAALSCCKTLHDAVTLKECISAAKKAGGTSTTSFAELQSLVSKRKQTMIDELVDEKTSQVLESPGKS